jgi:hypothetical protein
MEIFKDDKACALSKKELDVWAKRETGGKITACGFCDP